jgi:hypothetical protein
MLLEMDTGETVDKVEYDRVVETVVQLQGEIVTVSPVRGDLGLRTLATGADARLRVGSSCEESWLRSVAVTGRPQS